MDVELAAVAEADKPVLANLLQLYQYDFSEIRELDLTPHGTFTYRYLDAYFTEPGREAYFVTVDGTLAGFALLRSDVDDDGSWNIAEFFVVRRHRHRGVARRTARLLFAHHPGEWTLSFDRNNAPAAALWRSVVTEAATSGITETERPPPIAGTRLRFTV
ncbi:GNAT family N-acetyltransferase [Amycolatopsis sp. lyj-109]|uniref:GNAT family N-acetyltransferase n=1 Tax=Amycolatopsis sp. lyj-109 TaxID=2789287 RepID=UPI00397A20E3